VKCTFWPKTAILRFSAPFRGFRATCLSVHFRFIGKRVVKFLLVISKLFFARYYGWGATSDYWLKIGVLLERGQFGRKFQEQLSFPTNHSACRKTRMIDLSYGIKCGQSSFVLSQFTRLTDRQTDGRTDSKTAFPWIYCGRTVAVTLAINAVYCQLDQRPANCSRF